MNETDRILETHRHEIIELYKEVLKDFPGINEEEIIGISYDSEELIMRLSAKLYNWPYEDKIIRFEAELIVGDSFHALEKDLQKGIIAHEFGHYERIKQNKSITAQEKIIKWENKFKNRVYSSKGPSKERIEKWKKDSCSNNLVKIELCR